MLGLDHPNVDPPSPAPIPSASYLHTKTGLVRGVAGLLHRARVSIRKHHTLSAAANDGWRDDEMLACPSSAGSQGKTSRDQASVADSAARRQTH